MRKSRRQNRKEQDKTSSNEKKQTRMEQQIKITRQDVQQQHKNKAQWEIRGEGKKARCKLIIKRNGTENIETT